MHILVVCTNYTPEKTGMAPFATGLCEHWAAKGHKVTIVTAFPYYPEWRVWDGYRGQLYQKECINNVRLRRVRHFVPSRASHLIQRLAHDVSFAWGALLAGLLAGSVDTICCVCPPPTVAFSAYLLSKIFRKAYVIVLTDLASDAAMAAGILKDGPIFRLAKAIESFVYGRSDRIVCICDGFVEKLAKRGVPHQKLVSIPLWGDTQRIYPIARATEFRKVNQLSEQQFVAMYTGNLGKKQGLLNVVRAAELSKEVTDLIWLLVGQGEERSLIEGEITQRQLKNIRLLPFQPPEGLAEMYSSADVLLINQKEAIVDSVIPSKLLAYMAAGRAVLAAVNSTSEAARYIERAHCGVIVRPEDPKDLLNAVLSLRKNAALREKYGANGRAYVQEHFSKDKVCHGYDVLLSGYESQARGKAEVSKKPVAAS